MTRKTTFDLPHDLLQHAKHEAVERNTTLRALVILALRKIHRPSCTLSRLVDSRQLARRIPSGYAVHPPASPHGVLPLQELCG